MVAGPTVGLLALQGDVREHRAALEEVGAAVRPVRRPADLRGVDAMVLPGGESTTLSMLLASSGLADPLGEALAGGLPVLGTCAGMVLLASTVLDGRPDQRTFGVVDCAVRRNGYGRQRDSFETAVSAPAVSAALGVADTPIPAVFIRAPLVESTGPEVEVLATLDRRGPDGATVADPVLCRQGRAVVAAFHPELTGDRRLHRLLVAMTGAGHGVPDH